MTDKKNQKLPENFDIDIRQENPFIQDRSGFSIKNHPVLVVLLLNLFSVFIILFLVSGGHPIKKLISITKGIAYKVLEDDLERMPLTLFEKDLSVVKDVVASQYGADKFLSMDDITSQLPNLRRFYPILRNSKGNVFLADGGAYYYLSSDGLRLYQCNLAIPRPKRYTAPSAPVPVFQKAKVEKYERPPREIIYQDKDGTWKNYKD